MTSLSDVPSLVSTKKRLRAGQKKKLARARRVVGELRQELSRVRPDPYRVGTLLTTLRDERSFVQLGYRSSAAMLMGERLVSPGTARKHVIVAGLYRPKTLRALGVEKAYALVRWRTEAGASETVDELFRRDVIIGEKRFSECSVRDVRRATAARRAEAGSPRKIARVARDLERWLGQHGAGGYRVSPRAIDGEWFVEVRLRADDVSRITKS